MGGGSSKSESKTTVDPELLNLYKGNYQRAMGVADNYSYVPFTGERVAGFTPTQLKAQDFLTGIANDTSGQNNYSAATSAAKGLLNYDNSDLVKTSLADLQHARDQQQVADNQMATKAGSFGGTRQAVRDSLTTNDYLRNVATTSAGLRQGAAQLGLNAAGVLGNLTSAQLADATQRGGILAAVGDQQQGLKQAQNDAAYQEFLRQIQAPLQAQQIRNQSLQMIPLQQTQTTNSTSSPGLGGILGGIGSLGLGIASLGTGSLGGSLLGGLFGATKVGAPAVVDAYGSLY